MNSSQRKILVCYEVEADHICHKVHWHVKIRHNLVGINSFATMPCEMSNFSSSSLCVNLSPLLPATAAPHLHLAPSSLCWRTAHAFLYLQQPAHAFLYLRLPAHYPLLPATTAPQLSLSANTPKAPVSTNRQLKLVARDSDQTYGTLHMLVAGDELRGTRLGQICITCGKGVYKLLRNFCRPTISFIANVITHINPFAKEQPIFLLSQQHEPSN
jgi:hypothetical protein